MKYTLHALLAGSVLAFSGYITAASLNLNFPNCASYSVSGTPPNQSLECNGSVTPTPPPTPVPVPPPAPTYPACAGFDNTKYYEMTFPANGMGNIRKYTYNAVFANAGPGWGANDAVIVKFTALPNEPVFTVGYSFTTTMLYRTAVLSEKPCVFTQSADALWFGEASSATLRFSTTVPPYGDAMKLTGGKVYYLNLMNQAQGVQTCTPGSGCDASLYAGNPSP